MEKIRSHHKCCCFVSSLIPTSIFAFSRSSIPCSSLRKKTSTLLMCRWEFDGEGAVVSQGVTVYMIYSSEWKVYISEVTPSLMTRFTMICKVVRVEDTKIPSRPACATSNPYDSTQSTSPASWVLVFSCSHVLILLSIVVSSILWNKWSLPTSKLFTWQQNTYRNLVF